MGIRVNRLLTELNIGLSTLENILNVLGYKEQNLSSNTKLSDETAMLVRELYSDDRDFLSLIKFAAKSGVYGNQNDSTTTLNIIGRIASQYVAVLTHPPKGAGMDGAKLATLF